MKNYMFEDSAYADQYNMMVVIDDIIGREKLPNKPMFLLVGGTALLFHGVRSVFTMDIDCANKLEERVLELTKGIVSDMASEVINLPLHYAMRTKFFESENFSHIEIVLPSIEDLIITKLDAGRTKDIDDIIQYKLLHKCNHARLINIIETEYEPSMSKKLLTKLNYVMTKGA